MAAGKRTHGRRRSHTKKQKRSKSSKRAHSRRANSNNGPEWSNAEVNQVYFGNWNKNNKTNAQVNEEYFGPKGVAENMTPASESVLRANAPEFVPKGASERRNRRSRRSH